MRTNEQTQLYPVLALRGLAVFPKQTVHFDVGRDKSVKALEEAMKRECAIKKLSRPQKERLIESDANLLYTIGVPSEQHEAPTTESVQK